jgi:hypothetical protein
VSSGGILHDELWCKAALAYFRDLHNGYLEQGRSPIYSLGPTLCRSPSDYFIALSSMVNPAPPASNGAALFDFSDDEAGKEEAEGGADSLQVDARIQVLHFFSVQKTRLDRILVPKRAPKVGASFVAVQRHVVRVYDVATRTLRVQLEGDSGDPSLAPTLLSAALLGVDDFKTMRVWAAETELKYDLGFPVSADLDTSFQHVVNQLLESHGARQAGKRGFMYYDSEDPNFKIHACLQMLESRGMAQRSAEVTNFSSWTFTALGTSSLVVSVSLPSSSLALRARAGVSVHDATAFELAMMLCDAGWICMVKPSRMRRKSRKVTSKSAAASPSDLILPIDYAPGQPKHWWLTQTQEGFRVMYMRALMLAGQNFQAPVPHFKTEHFYDCLIKGIEFEPRRGKRFVMDGEPSKPRRKRARKAHAAAAATDEPHDAGLEDQQDHQHVRSDGGSTWSSPASDEQSGSSSTSSASSSSASAASSTSAAAGPGPAQEQELVPAPAGPPDLLERWLSRGLLDTTSFWKSFKFTEVKEFDVVVGFECTCKILAHKGAGRCTRSLRFARHGGLEATAQKLKWWATAGYQSNAPNRAAHQALPREPCDGLPSLDDLDATPVPAGEVGCSA